MGQFDGSVSGHISAAADDVFAVVIDVARLPEWNKAIQQVVGHPGTLEPGAEWVVRLRAPGLPPWNSRSLVLELDHEEHRFVHRSQTDDGNPSFAVWSWEVRPDGDGSLLAVGWKGEPLTFWRKVLLSNIRKRQLQREVSASVAALEGVVTRSPRQ